MREGAGRAWVFGDDVDTDAIAGGAWMKYGIDEIARHALEVLDPRFASDVRPGDLVVGGRNFGVGSSREQAPQALAHLGVRAVVATSFAGLFHRNAINLGLPAVVCPQAGAIRAGDRLVLDLHAARLHDLDLGRVLDCEPIPPFLLDILQAGGLMGALARRGTR
jgi:3-isopropylmalate/(R)-2-methylmalate dehydratase small subunit